MPTITLPNKFVKDENDNKFAPITTSGAVKFSDGDSLTDKFATTVHFSDATGINVVPTDGIRAETKATAATLTINPDVVTVITGNVGTAAITLVVPSDNLAHVWDIIMTTDSTVNITFATSNSDTILKPNGFEIGESKNVEISVIGIGSKFYLKYGEFA